MRVHSYKTKKGFTLIELMVSTAIFALVMVVTLGAILTIIDANHKAQALTTVMNNLNLSLESMTRTIKTNRIVSANGNTVTVVDDDQETDPPSMVYTFDEVDKRGRILFRGENQDNYIPITAPEVDIDSFNVSLLDPQTGCHQPKALIQVSGTAGANDRSITTFNIQTVVSQRDLNLSTDCFE